MDQNLWKRPYLPVRRVSDHHHIRLVPSGLIPEADLERFHEGLVVSACVVPTGALKARAFVTESGQDIVFLPFFKVAAE